MAIEWKKYTTGTGCTALLGAVIVADVSLIKTGEFRWGVTLPGIALNDRTGQAETYEGAQYCAEETIKTWLRNAELEG